MHSKQYLRHDCHYHARQPHDQHLPNTLQNHVVSCKNIITSCVRCGSKFWVKGGEVRRGVGEGLGTVRSRAEPSLGEQEGVLRGDAPANKRF